MKSKNLIILIVAAVGLSAVAYLTSHKSSSESPARMGELLLGDIAIDDVAAITLIGENSSTTTTLARTESGWVVPEKYNYPANYDRLHRAVVALTEVKIEQELTLSEKQKTEMHITAESPKLQFRDSAGKLMLEITLGDMRESKSAQRGPYGAMPTGRFISTDGGKSVVVVSETFYSFANPSPKTWLNTEVCSVPGAEISSITVSGPNRDQVSLKRDKDNKLTVADLKDGEEVDSSKTSAPENAISYLNFDDIASSDLSDEKIGMDKAVVFEAKTKDNLIYIVKVGAKVENGDNRYARFSVAYIEPEKTDKSDDGKAGEDGSKQQDEKAAAAREKAKALNDKLSKWTYIIPSYKAAALIKERSDLLKEKAEEEIKTEPTNTVDKADTSKDQPAEPQTANQTVQADAEDQPDPADK